MDSQISRALQRELTPDDFSLEENLSAERMRSNCDAFARRVVERYLAHELSWEDGDLAMNNVFQLLIWSCGDRVPDYAWDVYLAFDAGEHMEPGGDRTTRPLIEALLKKY